MQLVHHLALQLGNRADVMATISAGDHARARELQWIDEMVSAAYGAVEFDLHGTPSSSSRGMIR